MLSNGPHFPAWVPQFREILQARGIPSFTSDRIFVLSDYSGPDKGLPYRVFSFLLFNPSQSPDWPRLRLDLRAGLPDKRRFAYKRLSRSSYLRSKVGPFLGAADSLSGWCVTLAVHKSLKCLVSNKASCELWRREAGIQSNWNAPQFENMLRIVHFLSVLLAEIMGDCHSIEWVSDRDDIFANDDRCQDVTRVLRLSLGTYLPGVSAHILVGTSEIDTGDLGVEDLLAIPDFAAGAVGAFASAQEGASSVPPKAIPVGKWLETSSGVLRKCSLRFRPGPSGEVALSALAGLDGDEVGTIAKVTGV
ncbi:MAG: hypothetical protein ABR915_13855 [Thermoguttaceae bacterium]|jgi:hypothetical protein